MQIMYHQKNNDDEYSGSGVKSEYILRSIYHHKIIPNITPDETISYRNCDLYFLSQMDVYYIDR